MKTTKLFVLGAPDPEMNAIEALLRRLNKWGVEVAYATHGGGKRVAPARAYMADAEAPVMGVDFDGEVILVECGGSQLEAGFEEYWVDQQSGVWGPAPQSGLEEYVPGHKVTRVDHHRPGDPGFDCGPERFLEGSSIGQVLSLVAEEIDLADQWESTFVGQWAEGTEGWGIYPSSFEDLRWVCIECPSCSGTGYAEGEYARVHGQGAPCPDCKGKGTMHRWVLIVRGTIQDQPNIPEVEWAPAEGRIVPQELVLAAAGDHCPAEAYRGRCPGVNPDALMQWRAEQRAAFQGRSVEAILRDVARARDVLAGASVVDLGGCEVRDVRRYVQVCPSCGGLGCTECGDGAISMPGQPGQPERGDWQSYPIPELPEAALREGLAYLAGPIEDRDGRFKVVLGGAASPAAVEAFMNEWGLAQGLTDIYGVPARGFAGGYLP